ncbi:hypothetical protein HYFRA_00001722 [Hymenoscyphus fraxineus]|uniref:5'-3' DNA helicase ZGRF1-like N-terminal domain-containing protein n=1 Tax=Hymenoscyphus fraxineus TaxID=746836 RepID=A0A9N9L648_9HELO|nr:hypothetical protein HYFRA_00001722 [Hymenoscyphus fraxineus]
MSAHYEVPQTQNTAPVIEYRCLYTTDIKRKQKRWQDGILKFHTFNKKIMVCDDRHNFIGDAHWRQNYDFGEGEELRLERGDTLVQVEEQTGIENRDLSELLTKRQKEKEGRAAAMANASPNPAHRLPNFGTPSNSLKPKSLNAMLTPSGHHGRAVVSTTSPFEERQRSNNGNQGNHENERPPKRRKPDESTQVKSGYAQQLTGTKLTLASSKPSSTPTIRYEPFNRPALSHKPKATIDLTLDDETDNADSTPPEPMSRDDVVKQRKEKVKAQRMKRRRSPPPKSTYASNLTGVALSLNRPAPTSSLNKPSKKAAPQIQIQEKSDSSSEKDDSDNEGLQQPEPEPKKDLPKARNNPIQKKKVHLPDVPADPQRKSVPERPVSSLRIKSRPPRKMMMCMERPSSGTSGKRSSLSISFSDNSEPPQSQATMRLEAYTKKQEENLQARLAGKKPRLNLDLDDFASSLLVPDPPFDGGINYQDIDRRLSPKEPPQMAKGHISELHVPTKGTTRDSRTGMTENSGNKISLAEIFENGTSDSDTMFDEPPKARVPLSRPKSNRNAEQNLSSKPPTPTLNTPQEPHNGKIPPNPSGLRSLARNQELSCLPKELKDVSVDVNLPENSLVQAIGTTEEPGAEATRLTKPLKKNTADTSLQPARNPSSSKALDLIASPEAEKPPDKVVGTKVHPKGFLLQDLSPEPAEITGPSFEGFPMDLDKQLRHDDSMRMATDFAKTSPIGRQNEPVKVMDVVSARSPDLTEIAPRDGDGNVTMKSKNVFKERNNTDKRPISVQTSAETVKPFEKFGARGSNTNKGSSKSTSPPAISREALQAPIEHFRSIVQSASTLVPPVEEQPAIGVMESAVQPGSFDHVSADLQGKVAVPDLPPEDDASLPEPKSLAAPPTAQETPNIRLLNTGSFRSMHNVGGPFGQSFDNSSGGNDMVLSIAAMNQKQYKLTKPKPSLPPVPAFSAGKNNVENEGRRRERRPVTATGPWSKESFDLFGDWGPLV